MIAMEDIVSIVEQLILTDDISFKRLIEECKFEGKEREVVDAFWPPGFHLSYFEITEDVILKWLEPKIPGFAYTEFLLMLCKNYKEGPDYKIKRHNKNVKIYVLGSVWRDILMNSDSCYAPVTKNVWKKINEVNEVVGDYLKKRGLIDNIGQ